MYDYHASEFSLSPADFKALYEPTKRSVIQIGSKWKRRAFPYGKIEIIAIEDNLITVKLNYSQAYLDKYKLLIKYQPDLDSNISSMV